MRCHELKSHAPKNDKSRMVVIEAKTLANCVLALSVASKVNQHRRYCTFIVNQSFSVFVLRHFL